MNGCKYFLYLLVIFILKVCCFFGRMCGGIIFEKIFELKVCCFFGTMRGGITFELLLVVNIRYVKIVKKVRMRIFDDFVGKLKLKIKECYELI